MVIDELAQPNRVAANFEAQLQELDQEINGADTLANSW